MIDTFTWATLIPRHLYLDKLAFYDIAIGEFEGQLQIAGGIRVSGPIRLRILKFGYIDDDSMQEVIVGTELSPLWTFVFIRISCPAMKP